MAEGVPCQVMRQSFLGFTWSRLGNSLNGFPSTFI